jgi:hypothetical protein
MNKCLICGVDLDQNNQSEEHIIPNSLGGVLTSRLLICSDCNSKFGADCDAKLAEDLKLFANFLDIKRDRGENRPLVGEAPNANYLIRPGGKPELIKPVIEIDESKKGKRIHIEARDMDQAKEILEGLKRKHPEIDVERALSQAEHKREYLDEFLKLNFVFRGRDSLRAVVKMAFFYLKYKIPELVIDETNIISFLKNESDFREVYFFYPDTQTILTPDKTVCHSIIIKSYPVYRTLVAFVELYNSVSFIVELSHDFADEVQEVYIYDVLNRVELRNVEITYPLISRAILDDLFDNKPPYYDKVSKRFESFLKLALDRQHQSHRAELIQRAMSNSLAKHPEGIPITPEMIDEFVEKLMDEITPLLIRNLKGSDE